MNQRNKSCGILIGLKKAFKTGNHSRLLSKLYNYGIKGVVHDWFKSCLKTVNKGSSSPVATFGGSDLMISKTSRYEIVGMLNSEELPA